MSTILDKIIANKRKELEIEKTQKTIAHLEKQIEKRTAPVSFKKNIENSSTGIIAEFKRRSPSRDWIFKDAKIQDIVPYYSLAGATAISILTDYDFFGGTLCDLEKAASLTTTPLLRKDFIVDEYQLYQAAANGASAVLLIAAAMTPSALKELASKAKKLNLDILMEIHNEEELQHINQFVDVVGVNNRNLKTFETNINISINLAEKIPADFLKISESAISSVETILRLREVGYKGFLMGENFMKTENPGRTLSSFIHTLEKQK